MGAIRRKANGIRLNTSRLTAMTAVEWAASLPYSNGKVGMMGGSYVGATQMLAAIGAPPHLVGIAPRCDSK